MKTNFSQILIGSLLLTAVAACSEEDVLKKDPETLAYIEEAMLLQQNSQARLLREVCGESKEVRLIAGQHIDAGSVRIYNDETHLYVEYSTTDSWLLGATHLYVGKKEDMPATKSGNPKVGNFTYQRVHHPMVNYHTYSIPLEKLESCFIVAAHAEVHRMGDNGKPVQEETAWAEGKPMVDKGNWAMYVESCKQACVVEYPTRNNVATIAFEDLYPSRGDADYNDLIVDMHVKEYYMGGAPEKIEMVFRARARGAGFNHHFKLHLPVKGKAQVEIRRFASQLQADANNPYQVETMSNVDGEIKISVFPTTKTILPASSPAPYGFAANTVPGGTLVASHVATVTVLLEKGTEILLPPPYDPALHATNTVTKKVEEIHVLEITDKEDADGDGNKDYWVDKDGIHPFGIIIPIDWAWPLEKVNILKVYPGFKYIKDGDNYRPASPDWYQHRLEPATPEQKLYFKTEYFN